MTDQSAEPRPSDERGSGSGSWWLPRWVLPAIALFWIGYLLAGVVQSTWGRLTSLVISIVLSLFVALAIEPGVNRLSRRGWRRGTATITILLGVLTVVLLFGIAIGALVGSQVAELLSNTETYITDTVKLINDVFGSNINADNVIESYRDPAGPVQQYIRSQQDNALRLSVTALGMLLQLFTVLLFSFYLVADGPRLRRAICARLRPERQERVLATWEMAASKTGGYLYSRGLLALISAVFHWIVFQALGTAAPIPLALWVGVVSQFMPVVGTYLAGIVPVLITFLDSPMKALIVLAAIVLYQQIENYLLSPRVTARTMDLHPALAFGSAVAGASVLGVVGALIALPTAAMIQAVVSSTGTRYEVIDSDLVRVRPARRRGRRHGDDGTGGPADPTSSTPDLRRAPGRGSGDGEGDGRGVGDAVR